MNRAVNLLAKRLNVLRIRTAEFHEPSSSLIVPPPIAPRYLPILDRSQAETIPNTSPLNRIIPLHCPTTNRNQILSLPSLLKQVPKVAPSPDANQAVKVDPELNRSPITEPLTSRNAPMLAGPRALTIRRHKMRKHKRNKRIQRDWFKYQKYHREKKMRAEREFVKRMKGHLAELNSFNPEVYVEETISRAKREWSDELTPTGRRLYPHWSRLMSLEELYGLPNGDYIDKRAGYPSEEDKEQIRQLREKYRRDFLSIHPDAEKKGKEEKS
ncbi:unnamed protein product, partial [Mesorhabditis belari]|uniref:Mitochondrial mRNA-processing protein COX24 C-terminal domain-containing protein n=1 Tax=Mesorhabditis belari TaxID=2138241 RepID=A0AAF3EVH1_9BILA